MTFKDYSEGGSTSAVHPFEDQFAMHVAPSGKDGRNTLRFVIVPVACWRLNHAFFQYKSSVILPDISDELVMLELRVMTNPGCPAAIFGHADPVGDDEYNKTLAGRRALALFALLTRNVDLWEMLYGSASSAGDSWGLGSTQMMLAHLRNERDDTPYFAGDVASLAGPETDKAIRAFQAANGLEVDGVAGLMTRKALYRKYMDFICIAPGHQFVMKPEDFLGDPAQSGKGKGKGAYQGCGEFNPVVLLSQEEEARFKTSQDKSERNALNAPNRRLLVLLFRKGTQAGSRWPCPPWNAGSSACKVNFWPDGNKRRQPGPARREYRTDRRTMACRFFDRLAAVSPCEGMELDCVAYWDVAPDVEPTQAEVDDQSGNPDWDNGLSVPEEN